MFRRIVAGRSLALPPPSSSSSLLSSVRLVNPSIRSTMIIPKRFGGNSGETFLYKGLKYVEPTGFLWNRRVSMYFGIEQRPKTQFNRCCCFFSQDSSLVIIPMQKRLFFDWLFISFYWPFLPITDHLRICPNGPKTRPGIASEGEE